MTSGTGEVQKCLAVGPRGVANGVQRGTWFSGGQMWMDLGGAEFRIKLVKLNNGSDR